MKLARFDIGSGPRVGIATAGGLIDLELAGASVTSMGEIISGGAAVLDRVAKVAGSCTPHYPIEAVRLLAPMPRPGKYLAIGMNYRKHADEAAALGVETPKKQLWFNKQTTCLAGPYDPIDPGVTAQLDYEVELAVIIGAPARRVGAARAQRHIFGYCVANDVSARDWQFHSPTFTMGKSFDSHGPVGPWIVTADEIEDPHKLDLRCFVNGELRQSSNTSQMVHGIWDQIEYLSTAFTLEPGDLLATGTPEGVGVAMTPPRFLQAGDIVRCEIEGIGAIENKVASAAG